MLTGGGYSKKEENSQVCDINSNRQFSGHLVMRGLRLQPIDISIEQKSDGDNGDMVLSTICHRSSSIYNDTTYRTK